MANKYEAIPDVQIGQVIQDVKQRKVAVLEARNTIYKQYEDLLKQADQNLKDVQDDLDYLEERYKAIKVGVEM
tara:strand:+ start:336 stop:554 length:219 start_codon:yes stop_codon:yes gene_type:complete